MLTSYIYDISFFHLMATFHSNLIPRDLSIALPFMCEALKQQNIKKKGQGLKDQGRLFQDNTYPRLTEIFLLNF